jgi:aryl-alcohol dehydrogenase-like predicted oxidoreductase
MTLVHYRGQLAADAWREDEPLAFLTAPGVATSIPEAAYRFCRHELDMHTVLSGTGNVDHLQENIASLFKPPLPQAALQQLEQLVRIFRDTEGC